MKRNHNNRIRNIYILIMVCIFVYSLTNCYGSKISNKKAEVHKEYLNINALEQEIQTADHSVNVKSVKITEINSEYRFWSLKLTHNIDYQNFISDMNVGFSAYDNFYIDNGILLGSLKKYSSGPSEDWNETGSYYVTLHLLDEDSYFDIYVSKSIISFNNVTVEIPFSDFVFVERLEPQ